VRPDDRAGRPSYFEALSSMLHRGWAPLSGVIVGREKYIDLPIAERYDLATDRSELSNLAGQSVDRDRPLAAALKSFGATLPGTARREDPQTVARLRSLGYVGGSAPIKPQYTTADDPKALIAVDKAIHHGVDLYVAHRYGEAIQVYSDIVAQHPKMALAARHLAFVQWESGDAPAAIATLRATVAAGVSREEIVSQLGAYEAESGNARAAVALVEPVVAEGSTDVDTLNALGIAYARAGRRPEARTVFERILTIDDESVMAIENLGALDLAHGDWAGAGQRFQRAVALDPQSSQGYAGLGVVAMKRGDHRAAVDAWQRAVELDGTNYDALYNLATTLARDGRVDEARPYLERFVRTAPRAFYAKDISEVSAMLGK
jgi:tetratricopeptide (TPR) repeat protein